VRGEAEEKGKVFYASRKPSGSQIGDLFLLLGEKYPSLKVSYPSKYFWKWGGRKLKENSPFRERRKHEGDTRQGGNPSTLEKLIKGGF